MLASVIPYPPNVVGLVPAVICPVALTVTDLYVPTVTPELACDKVRVPLVVIAASLSIAIGLVACILTLVTVPLGSSPEGIRTQAVPSLINVSPIFAD
jgi:hypothetical protein